MSAEDGYGDEIQETFLWREIRRLRAHLEEFPEDDSAAEELADLQDQLNDRLQ